MLNIIDEVPTPSYPNSQSLRTTNSSDNTHISHKSHDISKFNFNRFATKKTIVQGMFDVALLTANFNQLKFVLDAGDKIKFPDLLFWMTTASIFLQILVGALVISIGFLDINSHSNYKVAKLLDNFTVVMVFLISCINVMNTVFGYGLSDPSMIGITSATIPIAINKEYSYYNE